MNKNNETPSDEKFLRSLILNKIKEMLDEDHYFLTAISTDFQGDMDMHLVRDDIETEVQYLLLDYEDGDRFESMVRDEICEVFEDVYDRIDEIHADILKVNHIQFEWMPPRPYEVLVFLDKSQNRESIAIFKAAFAKEITGMISELSAPSG